MSDCTRGYLDLTVTCDENLQIVPISKSDDNQQTINLTVYDSKDEVVAQWDDIAQITAPVQLLTGRYKAVATYGEEAYPVAFDSPFYTGETEFTIRPDIIASANVICTLTSLKVTAEMASEITDDFDYTLIVSNGLGELVFDDETIDCEGYFAVTDHIEWTLVLVNAENESFTFSDRYESVTATQHYALTFSIENDTDAPEGAAGPGGYAAHDPRKRLQRAGARRRLPGRDREDRRRIQLHPPGREHTRLRRRSPHVIRGQTGRFGRPVGF